MSCKNKKRLSINKKILQEEGFCTIGPVMDGNWSITVLNPNPALESATVFQYRLDNIDEAGQDMSNIRICLCPELDREELEALIASVECVVTFEDGTQMSGCIFEVSGNNEGNPLECENFGLQISGFATDEELKQDFIDITITFNQPVEVLEGDVGYASGQERLIWPDVCAVPGCPVITRGILVAKI